MPYRQGETPAQTAKIDRCIKKVMASGKDRSSATAICIAQVHDKAEEVGNKMLRKQFAAEFKALTPEDGATQPGEFEAIVAVYDNVDSQGDRIKAGAFDETLAAWRKAGDPIPVIMAHGWDDPWKHVGYAMPENVKSIPGRGLYARGVLDIDDNPLAKQLHRLMERRTIKEFSFGYRVPAGGERKADDGAYDLLALDLIEFGPCLKGVNQETELLAIKSELDAERRRERGEEPTIDERFSAIEATLAELKAAVVPAEPAVEPPVEPEPVEPEGKADETPEPIVDEAKMAHDQDEEAAYAEKAEREAREAEPTIKSADLELEGRIQDLLNFEKSKIGRHLLSTDPDIDDARSALDEYDV